MKLYKTCIRFWVLTVVFGSSALAEDQALFSFKSTIREQGAVMKSSKDFFAVAENSVKFAKFGDVLKYLKGES